MGPDGVERPSSSPGTLGGHRGRKIFGRLDCRTVVAALARGYARRRVFFRDEADAVAAGYRPCGNCMRDRYLAWKVTSSR